MQAFSMHRRERGFSVAQYAAVRVYAREAGMDAFSLADLPLRAEDPQSSMEFKAPP
jgi:hypothetical protein